MVRYAVATLCVALTVLSEGSSMSSEEFGFQMSTNAYEAVCWWENLKQFPQTNTKAFTHCTTQAEQQMNQIMTKDFFVENPDMRLKYFGQWIKSSAMSHLPSVYEDNCGDALDDPKMAPVADEGDALNDGGNDYPYKGYAYCMMNTLRKEHGDEAIEAVKNERTHAKKHWMSTLLDRENEFRARHGVEPLKLMKDLNTAAQAWAEENAKSCDMHHSDGDSRKYKGQSTGESLSAGIKAADKKEEAAYSAADGWYEEVQKYPFPEGFQGDQGDPLFGKIGHFTQSVWKGSKYVGYGYAYNADCPGQNRFIAARYFPAGNEYGSFTKNVMPPKEK